MKRELSNAQRARLEKIAKEEFEIRERELEKEKQKEYDAWEEKEIKDILATDLGKKYIKARDEKMNYLKTLGKKGFMEESCYTNFKHKLTLSDYTEHGRIKHPGLEKADAKCYVSKDDLKRELNKVITTIWKIEQPFEECVKLIENAAKNLK
jgi:hypothetical protein